MDMHKYLIILSEQIRCKRARPMVVKELMQHMEDQKSAYIGDGMTVEEAEEEAVRQMGDPIQVGMELDRIHRPQLEWRILGVVIILSIIGIGLQYMVTLAGQGAPEGGIVYFLSRSSYLVKQIGHVALGIGLMAGIYFLDYSILGKYARQIWLVGIAGVLLYPYVSSPVNGGYTKISAFAYLLIPVYAGIVYFYKGKGKKGMWICIAYLIVSEAVFFTVSGLNLTMIAIGVTILHIAIYQGWFGVNRKSLYLQLWGGILFIPIAGIISHIIRYGTLLEEYQRSRLLTLLQPGSVETYQYVSESIAEFAHSSGTRSLAWNVGMDEAYVYIRGDFLWLFLSERLGMIAVILLTAVIIGLLVLMFRSVFRQKNKLGYIVGFSCTLLLLIQVICYLGMNYGFLPWGKAFMPFLSWGGTNLCIAYIYAGLLLSIHRNHNLIKT